MRVRRQLLIDCVVTYLNSESHVGSPNLSSGRLDTFFICSKSASLFVARALNCSSLALDMRMMHENTPGYSVGRMWTLSTGQRHMTGEQTSHVHLGSPISPRVPVLQRCQGKDSTDEVASTYLRSNTFNRYVDEDGLRTLLHLTIKCEPESLACHT